MKNFKNKCLGGVAVISLLACTNFVQASTTIKSTPQVTFHHQQVSSNKVNVDLGVQNLGNEVVALEVSFVADDIKSVLQMASKVENSYITYQLLSQDNGKEKLNVYIISEDKEKPFGMEDGRLSGVNLSLQTSGKLTVETSSVSIKAIEKGYVTTTYDKADLVYTEGSYKPSDSQNTTTGGGSNNTSSNSGETNNNETIGSINFIDIESHWAKSAILNMANKGIIKGYADGSFKPSASITRGEFAVLLARAFELEKSTNMNPFKDVMADKWYTDGILALYDAGITSGRADGTFGVNAPITNEEISTMLYRTSTVLNMKMAEINPSGIQFTDHNEISNYAKEAVEALTKLGIISGQPNGSFGPKASTSRAQVAVMLERVFTLVEK